MSSIREYRKKVQPADKSFSSSNTDTGSDLPNSRGSDPSNVIISPTRNTAKISALKPRPNALNLVSVPETSVAKSLEMNIQAAEVQFVPMVFKKPGTSILKKAKIGYEAQNKSETMEALKSNKKQRLIFKDALEQVNIIENWKEYNTDTTYANSATCYCSTF